MSRTRRRGARRNPPGVRVGCWTAALLCLVGGSCGPARDPGVPAGAGRIVRLDPGLDRLIPSGATIEKVADGYRWTEGPVWDSRRGALLFSDVPANAIYEWREGVGTKVFLEPSGDTGPERRRRSGSNGLAFDPEGRLLLCAQGDRRIIRLEADGRRTTLADRYQGRRLNNPNDLVVGPDGGIYFTDPPFGLPKRAKDPSREMDWNGVYRVATDGTLDLLTREVPKPNGLAFSPSGAVLYVSNADHDRAVWMAFDVRPDGSLGPGRVFFDATTIGKGRKGSPDGLKVDAEGNLFASGPGGIYVLAPNGTHLGTIELPDAVSNCAWGDDGKTLYVTAASAVYRVRLGTRGAGF